jgi:hypothetical protein
MVTLTLSAEHVIREISKLPKTMEWWLDALARKTRWTFTLTAGGPNPKNGGRLTTLT